MRILAVVIAPIAAGYALSFFFRNSNAVLAPELMASFGLGAAEIGILTSVFFAAAALQYVPLALLLDRYGPRRLFIAQVLMTALACLVSANADSFAMLVLGRALIGFGLAACLTTALKAVTVWFPRDRLATGNALILFAGGFGALAATRPLQVFVEAHGWRAMYLAGLAACLVLAGCVAILMPERNAPPVSGRGAGLAAYRDILTHPVYWRVAPASALGIAGFFAIQGLWANGWMSDVAGLTQIEIGERLFAMALAMSAGTLGNGLAIDYLARRGVDRAAYIACGLSVLLIANVSLAASLDPRAYWPWVLMGLTGNIGVLVHPILNRTYPAHYAARSISTIAIMTFALVFVIQSGMGVILDLWGAAPDGRYPPEAYRWGLGSLVLAEAVCLAALAASLKRLRAEAQKADR